MVQAVNLVDVQTLIPHMFCPVCFRTELEAVLRCDLDRRDCLPAAHCLHCGYTFEPESFRRAEAAIERRLLEGKLDLPCPTCGRRASVIELRCDLADRECSYVITCRACGESRRMSL